MTNDVHKVVGKWEPLFDLANVAAHASLLPTGKILYWGRRSNPKDTTPASMNELITKPFILDPATGKSKPTASEPKALGDGAGGVNLFCSGHSFQADGSLFIVGGHIRDGVGVNQTCIYNPFNDTWTAKQKMNAGRWYPTALTLADGSVLSISGQNGSGNNINPQIWRNDNWVPVNASPAQFLYPRLHLDPKGRVFMAGPQAQSMYLDVKTDSVSTWDTKGPLRKAAAREYAPSVQYDSGKIIYIGGGNDAGTNKPTNMTEIIDLNHDHPNWEVTAGMKFGRRQHNATVLPDGTVLVTGGTQGAGFNDVSPGMPVHQAELWDPATKTWTPMAEESADRCYHSIALLLPDGQVLSAGGGEYSPKDDGFPNPPKDTLTNAQLYKPPYLFKGGRPTIKKAPHEIIYGQKFEVTVNGHDLITKVSWVRLGSVTHACNFNQSLQFLPFKQQGSKITVDAPARAALAPPGHYMLFVLNEHRVPSVAPIIRIKQGIPPAANGARNLATASLSRRTVAENHVAVNLPALNEKIITQQERPAVVIGLTPVCPYGLGPCWGGAFEALQRINDVEVVRPMPNQADSVAFVYLREDKLPDIDVWRSEFEKSANGSYFVRGLEMTLTGAVTRNQVNNGEQLTLASTPTRPELVLAPFQATSKIQYDMKAKAPKPTLETETEAYASLSGLVGEHSARVTVQVVGPLQKHGDSKFSLEVREFTVIDATASEI